jgi:hypothetical protein
VSINGSAILLEHVDDLGITTPTEKELDEIEQKIEQHVELERRDQKGLFGIKNSPTNRSDWQKILTIKRLEGLRRNKRGRRTSRSEEIPATNRKPSVHSPRNKTRYQSSGKSIGKTSNQTEHTKLQDNIKGLGVFVLDKAHRAALTET